MSTGHNRDFHIQLVDVKIIKSFCNQFENMCQVQREPKNYYPWFDFTSSKIQGCKHRCNETTYILGVLYNTIL